MSVKKLHCTALIQLGLFKQKEIAPNSLVRYAPVTHTHTDSYVEFRIKPQSSAEK